jgi:enoyl-CoA hydratase/carnithine racemase
MNGILEVSRIGRVVHLRLNRPEKRNALSAGLCRALVRAMEDADADHATGALLLTAEGPVFCAGMDLTEVRPGITDEINPAHEQLFTIGARLSKPLIGAVAGAALGGGMGLAANCHIVIASEQATFGLTEIRLGLWPFLVFRAVTAAVGERRALEMSLTGRTFGAAEARGCGLVQEVVASAGDRARAVAEAIADSSPTAIRSGMTFAQEVRGRAWQEAGEIARRVRNEVFESADFREGIAAFREKRKPKWPSLG